MKKFELPVYVSMGGRTEMKLTEDKKEHYRIAGQWSVGYEVRDGKVFSVYNNEYSPMPWLNNVELIPITEKEWREGNEGYV